MHIRSRAIGLSFILLLAGVALVALLLFVSQSSQAQDVIQEDVSPQFSTAAYTNVVYPIAVQQVTTALPLTMVWDIQCVDCPKYFTNMGDRSLRLDADGHPHIAYGGDHLYYAWYDGITWHIETVDSTRGVGRYTSLALDAAGRPHISYYDETNGGLKYTWWSSSAWFIQTIDGTGDVGGYTSLALDADGRPHIS